MSEKSYSREEGYYSIDDLLKMNGVRQRRLVDQLKAEEAQEVMESEDHIKADILAHKKETERQKKRFINEIKGSLGQEIKANPSGYKFIKKPWYKKLGSWFKNIFTKF